MRQWEARFLVENSFNDIIGNLHWVELVAG